jgi:hypothetical protein
MNEIKEYGKSETEVHVEKMNACREIVTEILNFGVTDSQKLKIIYLLSLELENRENLVELSKTAKNIIDKKLDKKLITLE